MMTRKQVELVLQGRVEKDLLPTRKGNRLLICHAYTGEPYQVDLEEIELTSFKSDSGERLWRLTQSSRDGRDFDASVQEAHVVAYLNKVAEDLRQENLQRHSELLAQMDDEYRRSRMACAAM